MSMSNHTSKDLKILRRPPSSVWPPYIGAENKLPGQEGVVSTYLPFDADLRGITAHDVETHVPFYRNLSAAVIGLILSIGYDPKLAAKYWNANFEEIKGGTSGLRTDQILWGGRQTRSINGNDVSYS